MAKKKEMKPKRKRHEIIRDQIRKRALKRRLTYSAIPAVITVVLILAIALYNTISKDDDGTDNLDGKSGQNGTIATGTEIGQIAPDFDIMDTEGHNFNLWSQRGSPAVLDFMATWCGPCEEEIEHLKAVRSHYDNNEVQIISIGVDDTENSTQLEDFKLDHSCDWTFAAGGGVVGGAYDIINIPTICIIDRQGIIAYKSVGVSDYDTLQPEIDMLL